MKKLKYLKKYTLIVLTGFMLTSCFGEDNFLTDNLEETGRSFPNITDVTILDSQSEYSEGDIIQIDVRFWSEDSVEQIILYDELKDDEGSTIQAIEIATSAAYDQASFSEESQTDFVILEYEVPDISSDPTEIILVIEVLNENGLTERNTESKNPTIRDISVTAVQ